MTGPTTYQLTDGSPSLLLPLPGAWLAKLARVWKMMWTLAQIWMKNSFIVCQEIDWKSCTHTILKSTFEKLALRMQQAWCYWRVRARGLRFMVDIVVVLQYLFRFLLFWTPAAALSQSPSSIFQIDQSRRLVKVNRSNNTTVLKLFSGGSIAPTSPRPDLNESQSSQEVQDVLDGSGLGQSPGLPDTLEEVQTYFPEFGYLSSIALF